MEQGLREDRPRGAIQVKQQPDDAKFDTLDFGYASVRWMMNASPVFGAIGPSQIDPRSGEILDADMAFEGMATREHAPAAAQPGGCHAVPAATFAFAAPLEPPAELNLPTTMPAAACTARWPPNSWPTRWT
jgi:hypothetical protein